MKGGNLAFLLGKANAAQFFLQETEKAADIRTNVAS